MSVCALVAAAGASTRLGSPKALLPFGKGGQPFVVVVARALLDGGVDHVIVTVPENDVGTRVIQALAECPRGSGQTVTVACNRESALGLSGSVRSALASAGDDVSHFVLAPVDAPFFTAALVRALLARARDDVDIDVVVAGSGSLRGHPAVFARSCFQALWTAGARGGPRAVIDDAAGANRLGLVHADDARVAVDVDTIADWEHAFGVTWPGPD
jgi:CTP:molybdopterin cytidylyltransferase MocA